MTIMQESERDVTSLLHISLDSLLTLSAIVELRQNLIDQMGRNEIHKVIIGCRLLLRRSGVYVISTIRTSSDVEYLTST